jgi:pyridine nucleotide-disulfide oxidoreductase family protein
MKKLVLVGGGHAHLLVLKQLSEHRLFDVDVTLITPDPYQIYSGMLPGWIAGHYALEQIQIDLRPLVAAANVHLVLDTVIGIDAESRCITMSSGRQVEYDLLSLDTGSETDISGLEQLGQKLLPIKPLRSFVETWPLLLRKIQLQSDYELAIVGGGAASVEMVLAAHFAIQKMNPLARVLLVFPETGLLASHPAKVRQRVTERMHHAGIQLIAQRASGTDTGLLLANGDIIDANHVIAATGARAADWLASSGLALSDDGFVAVDAMQRSISHPDVFATGDVCARQDVSMARSGVHAVRAGSVLANNLLAALSNADDQSYHPRKSSLYLISCGEQYAVASWCAFSGQGRWVWRLKDYIDRRFVAGFSTR